MDFNAEIDRVVREHQVRIDQLTTRSGVLTAIAALASSITASQIQAQKAPAVVALVVLTVSVVVGVVVLCGRRIVTDPTSQFLAGWQQRLDADALVFWAKVQADPVNRARVHFVEVAFYIQAVAVAAAVVLVMIGVAWR